MAVVVAEPRGLEVELDRQVLPDGDEVAPLEDVVVVLGELGAELLRLDRIEVRVDPVDRCRSRWTSFAAVFSPTPGMPGMLSVVSPLSALKSIICVALRP